MADLVQYYGTGRRKSAIARVFLRPGTGEFKVNGKAFDTYFVTEQQRVSAKSPWSSATPRRPSTSSPPSPAAALPPRPTRSRWASPAPCSSSTPSCARPSKPRACSPATPACKERKKYGQKGARKRFQFCKR